MSVCFRQRCETPVAGASEVVNFSFQHCHPGQRAPMSRGRKQFCGGLESEAADSPVRLSALILGFLNPLTRHLRYRGRTCA